jgi:hypothetical protein
MATSYTSALRLSKPADGDTNWGTTVNNGVTTLAEQAIAGRAAVAMTDADYTLTATNGASDEARNMVVRMTGALTATRNVICPTANKLYIVENATTGGQSIIFKTTAGTGITILNGTEAAVRCDGTNVVRWVSTALPVAQGGTGSTTAADARVALGTMQYAGVWNSGTTYSFNQMVFYQAATYMVLTGSLVDGNLNNAPPDGGSNANWTTLIGVLIASGVGP